MGATPLDFSLNHSVDSIRDWVQTQGMEVNCCMAMGSSLEEIALAGCAHVNLVVSYGGLAAAKSLQAIFNTPYVVGVPIGRAFADSLGQSLQHSAKTGENKVGYSIGKDLAISTESTQIGKDLVIIGESVYSASLACAIEKETGKAARVLCPLDTNPELLRRQDVYTPEEDDLLYYLPKSCGVIADPLYRPLCPEELPFYSLPHEAFSGRMYDAENPNLMNRELKDFV